MTSDTPNPDPIGTSSSGPTATEEALRRTRRPEPPPLPRSRPPAWLIVLTLAIPVGIGLMWYSNWYGRKLTADQVVAALAGTQPTGHVHGLAQFDQYVTDYMDRDRTGDNKVKAEADLERMGAEVLRLSTRSGSQDQVRASVAWALGRFAVLPFMDMRRQAESQLEEMVLADRDLVKLQAACALTNFGRNDPHIIETLRLALGAMDSKQRLNAVMALGQVGGRDVADDLQRLSQTDPDGEVRFRAAEAHQRARGR